MKKIKVLFSFLILLLALYGCGGSSNSVSTKNLAMMIMSMTTHTIKATLWAVQIRLI